MQRPGGKARPAPASTLPLPRLGPTEWPGSLHAPRTDPSQLSHPGPCQLGGCLAARPRAHPPLSRLPAVSGACRHLAQLGDTAVTRCPTLGSPEAGAAAPAVPQKLAELRRGSKLRGGVGSRASVLAPAAQDPSITNQCSQSWGRGDRARSHHAGFLGERQSVDPRWQDRHPRPGPRERQECLPASSPRAWSRHRELSMGRAHRLPAAFSLAVQLGGKGVPALGLHRGALWNLQGGGTSPRLGEQSRVARVKTLIAIPHWGANRFSAGTGTSKSQAPAMPLGGSWSGSPCGIPAPTAARARDHHRHGAIIWVREKRARIQLSSPRDEHSSMWGEEPGHSVNQQTFLGDPDPVPALAELLA